MTTSTTTRNRRHVTLARVGLCAAVIALGGAGYTPIAYATPCDPSTDLTCQGTPPQGPDAPRPARRIPTDQLTVTPQVIAPGLNPQPDPPTPRPPVPFPCRPIPICSVLP
jgi:hypothetical protein